MSISFTPAQLEQFRRDAKRLARAQAIPLNQAQDQIAAKYGFQNWSLLAKRANAARTDKPMVSQMVRKPLPPVESPTTYPRYYLHGDQVEGDTSKYFCRHCDAFVEEEHFIATHGVATLEHALYFIERRPSRDPDWLVRNPRPIDAVNIVEGPARAARLEYEASRAPFHRWLEQQRQRRGVIGDLAGDVFRDKGFPVSAISLDQIEGHLIRRGAAREAVSALKKAWREFSKAA